MFRSAAYPVLFPGTGWLHDMTGRRTPWSAKTFVGLLRVLEQNPLKPWNEHLTPDLVSTAEDVDPNATPVAEGPDELAEFKL